MATKQSSESLDDDVIVFYDSLFGRIFSVPFRAQIADLSKERAVLRQVEESADAVSQSLIRLLQNERLDPRVATGILGGLACRREAERVVIAMANCLRDYATRQHTECSH